MKFDCLYATATTSGRVPCASAARCLKRRSVISALARSTSPFADLARRKETVWLEPVLEAEVSYGQIVGGQLRAPVLRRFVTELTPARSSRRGARHRHA
jgi:hypothetical protein